MNGQEEVVYQETPPTKAGGTELREEGKTDAQASVRAHRRVTPQKIEELAKWGASEAANLYARLWPGNIEVRKKRFRHFISGYQVGFLAGSIQKEVKP